MWRLYIYVKICIMSTDEILGQIKCKTWSRYAIVHLLYSLGPSNFQYQRVYCIPILIYCNHAQFPEYYINTGQTWKIAQLNNRRILTTPLLNNNRRLAKATKQWDQDKCALQQSFLMPLYFTQNKHVKTKKFIFIHQSIIYSNQVNSWHPQVRFCFCYRYTMTM